MRLPADLWEHLGSDQIGNCIMFPDQADVLWQVHPQGGKSLPPQFQVAPEVLLRADAERSNPVPSADTVPLPNLWVNGPARTPSEQDVGVPVRFGRLSQRPEDHDERSLAGIGAFSSGSTPVAARSGAYSRGPCPYTDPFGGLGTPTRSLEAPFQHSSAHVAQPRVRSQHVEQQCGQWGGVISGPPPWQIEQPEVRRSPAPGVAVPAVRAQQQQQPQFVRPLRSEEEALAMARVNSNEHSPAARGSAADRQEMPKSMMVRNLPPWVTQEELLRALDEGGFAGAYDFCYLPWNFHSHTSHGYAFVNFINDDVVAAFIREWNDSQHFCSEAHSTPMNVTPALTQGLPDLLALYQRKKVQRVRNPKYRPFVRLQAATLMHI
mmetsp:Transcript_58265/g.138809  ORF Transcript_58265/g.138809 Transcript_58265/m.138809 type:complete len:378 (-) Transcript_58265:69-1202(-)